MAGVRWLLEAVSLAAIVPVAWELQRWIQGPFTAWCTERGQQAVRRILGEDP